MIDLAMLIHAALAVLCGALAPAPTGQTIERQVVLTITPAELDGGILTELTWDNGALLLQGALANADGTLSARYVVVPAKSTACPAVAIAVPAESSTLMPSWRCWRWRVTTNRA